MNKENKIRLRFAPSPTGYLHIGSLRTALFTYIIAKNLGGKIILRVEDTDQKRKVEGAVEKLIEILDWVGIKFDEGPHTGGDYGPYVQTERLSLYKKYANELLEQGKAYRCFCSSERLEKMRKNREAAKLPSRYDRKCRDLSEAEIGQKIKAGEKFVIRQKMPFEGEVKVYDEIRGEITFRAEDLEDHVLIKSDGIPTYHFAVVVDDHLMEISHVTRADEWIPSFPKNTLLYRDFGWTPPKFIHYPIILNKQGGGKLSKRQGDVAVEEYRDKGYLKEALINFCALLGWHPKGENEILSLEQIIEDFRIEDMGANPAVFDVEKLDFFNGYYIRQKGIDELSELVLPFFIQAGMVKKQGEKFWNALSGEEISFEFIRKAVALARERMKKLADAPELVRFLFEPKLEYDQALLAWKDMDLSVAKENLKKIRGILEAIPENEWNRENLENKVKEFIAANSLKNGEYLWPLRVVLTGLKASPGPFEIAEALGKNKTMMRIHP